ncbi:origin recognition complex subunit 2-like [Dendronephthya gigantea]|uniref:origin recognition complex subunit 2-like n=1 Tax=Dendronephthya gigantea TaxID=151771 RepID=UPI00106B0653|nr:origin recognition complex subunit 2-like [Dendronephthya gigantea]
MATSISCESVPVTFIDEEDVTKNFSPARKGLRSTGKGCKRRIPDDDRRSRYFDSVTLDDSSDDDEIIHPSGEAVLTQTPISSHDVFSFQNTKRKTALANAASEARHIKEPQPVRKGNKHKLASEGSSEESSEYSSSDDLDDEDKSMSKDIARAINMKELNNNNMEDMLDNYFLAHDEKDCLTSDRTLSSLSIPRMDQETLSAVLKSRIGDHQDERRKLYEEYRTYFPKWAFQLRNGFNLLLHGLGSKRSVIDSFRSTMLSKSVQLVVNGFFPSITVKNILNTITNDIINHDGTFKSIIEQCNFIKDYYNENDSEKIYLIIHNIDGTMLRSNSTQTILSSLAQCSSIHLIASIDHIHAPLIWDQTQMGRFSWLWYDVTTFEPYTEETSYENSLLVQQSGSLALSSLIHVFRSLTPNAKEVFILIANYQLEYSKESNYAGMSFHDCYTKCRGAFLVNSDATLSAQLTEFRDHKLIRSKKGTDGVEYLLIPLDDNILKQFVEDQENNT